jgi:adenylate kinase family enzyme
MQIVFIEGVPGSGKSSMAEQLCSNAASLGSDVRWYLEESQDNPVRMSVGNAAKSHGYFAEECLSSWASFVDQCQGQKTVHIFEGIAFQSTVRFMMDMRENGIERYYRRFEETVECLKPRMVYLRPRDIASHSRHVCDLRDENWSYKVSSYLAQTQYSIYHGLRGVNGMHQYWAKYADLCDDLLLKTTIPTKVVDFVFGEWDRHMVEASTFLGLERISDETSANQFNVALELGTSRQSA